MDILIDRKLWYIKDSIVMYVSMVIWVDIIEAYVVQNKR
jgi:hypothetical protein